MQEEISVLPWECQFADDHEAVELLSRELSEEVWARNVNEGGFSTDIRTKAMKMGEVT